MNTPDVHQIDPDDLAQLRQGRRFPYATVGDYVALSDVSDRACRVYWLLRMHINSGRGDERAWPAQKSLAQILKLKKTDTIGAAIRELVDLGAVTVEVNSTPHGRANIYTVHEAPPEDFSGPKRLSEFYKLREETAGQATSPPAKGSPPNRRRIGGQKPSSTDITPQKGVIPGHPPERGQGSPPADGSELPVVEPPEILWGEVTGERHLRERTPDANPPPPIFKADWRQPRHTWLCSEHGALFGDDPGADRPACRKCAEVREWAERNLAAQAAALVDTQVDRVERERAERLASVEQGRAEAEAARERALEARGGPGHAEYLAARAELAGKKQIQTHKTKRPYGRRRQKFDDKDSNPAAMSAAAS